MRAHVQGHGPPAHFFPSSDLFSPSIPYCRNCTLLLPFSLTLNMYRYSDLIPRVCPLKSLSQDQRELLLAKDLASKIAPEAGEASPNLGEANRDTHLERKLLGCSGKEGIMVASTAMPVTDRGEACSGDGQKECESVQDSVVPSKRSRPTMAVYRPRGGVCYHVRARTCVCVYSACSLHG